MLRLKDATHAEYEPDAATRLIAPVSCPVIGRAMGAPKLSGRLRISLREDSLARKVYPCAEIEEEFFCNYELNPDFQKAIDEQGLKVAGVSQGGEARIVELPHHPFFLATLFLPQLSSRPGTPHPVITAYLDVVRAHRNDRR